MLAIAVSSQSKPAGRRCTAMASITATENEGKGEHHLVKNALFRRLTSLDASDTLRTDKKGTCISRAFVRLCTLDEPGRAPPALAVFHRRCLLLSQERRGLFVRECFT
jgi:hypothetical protein